MCLSLNEYWDTTWVLLNTSFYVFLVMAALKTMFARTVLANGRPTHEPCAETVRSADVGWP